MSARCFRRLVKLSIRSANPSVNEGYLITNMRELCQDLFYSLEWTYPTTLLEEWDSNGYFDEIEGWYDSND